MKTRRKNVVAMRALPYLAQAALVFAIFWNGMGFTDESAKVPVTFYFDAMLHSVVARSIVESGSWRAISRLSYPYEMNLALFPVNGHIDAIIQLVFAQFTSSFGKVMHFFWAASMVFSAWSATWCLKRLGAASAVSLALGVSYAFLPRAFARNTEYLMLVYYLLPFACTLGVLTIRGSLLSLPKPERWILYAACVAIGFNYAYNAFFACYLLFVACLVRWMIAGFERELKACAIGLGLIMAAAIGAIVPSVIAWKADPVAAVNMNQKPISQSDMFGMKLRQLITPIGTHPLKPWREFARKVETAGFPLEYENAYERLGTLGSLGFLFLLLIIIVPRQLTARSGKRIPLLEDLSIRSREAASLNLAIFLLATIGGIGTVYNVLISPDVRSYARASVFISFLALIPVAALLSRLTESASKDPTRLWLARAALLALALAAIPDQVTFEGQRINHSYSINRYQVAEEFVRRIESSLPSGAAIYQMPYLDFPNTPMTHQMGPHEHALGYVLSEKLKWSWGALSGQALEWNRSTAKLSPEALIVELRARGFSGIWLDRGAYADGATQLMNSLAASAGNSQPIQSTNGRYAFLTIR